MFAGVKRIFLFFTVNILILLTLSLAFQIFCSLSGFHARGVAGLWVFYGLIGMGGALINLALSRIMAKWMMGVRVLDPQTCTAEERRLVEMVHRLAERAELPALPEVGIYESPEVNAFATGPSRRRSLVAVSTGLLSAMDSQALEGVLGHEVTHIANGDMVTMTLLQGVINTMVLIGARLISSLIASAVEERARPWVQFTLYYVIQILLSLLGSMVVCYFSRAREFRADAGGARLAGRGSMIRGLSTLKNLYEVQTDARDQAALATLKIAGPSKSLFHQLFSTHPPLEERIAKLQNPATF